MLLEVLVALAVAALVLGALARILATGWDRSRVPMEQVSALGVALAVATESGQAGTVARDGHVGRFAYTATVVPLTIEQLPDRLAPPLERLDAADKRPAAGTQGVLQQISIVVRAANRSVTLETVRLELPPR